ncbi:YqhR family membrane protein [Paenibacillus radicis (ex Xue et al. 2023)]|uniref:YqhR family membrane protein n=1 Tax=Paenibacillus radicis (ex Xue et al. 2023) TaxID=2972489 RepID=A0ABT1YLB4_9BACL|nr:YqhR family membrane protein [Paenibacillus radicis (ex Xue et al. 2023)]MCR8633971.1 YqhR family membrane protein [Paenibacillus radicis (ex Xue et al. 2023)]
MAAEGEKGTDKRSNKWTFSLYIGFFAGLLWGAVKMVEHYFHFTSLPPGFLVEPFFKNSFLLTWKGYLLGWAVFILFSIVATLLYTIFLAKAVGPWVGIMYGLAIWGIIFLLVGPITGMMNWIAFLDWNTILTEACLFMLWGLFIGYSIAFEFNDESVREPFSSGSNKPQPE